MPTTIVDKTACELAGQGHEGGLLPISPFTALQFHFGMLLGVDDLETGQAYPRGKMRLHNAWLHREGVVWGFGVTFNERHELSVHRGLAIDAAGHELHLDHVACVDLAQWFQVHKDDPEFTHAIHEAASDGTRTLSVHVVARFKACLTRPVPAIVEPCAGAQTDTKYSRVFETVELLLRPGVVQRKDPGYHRLRILFHLEHDHHDRHRDVIRERHRIQSLPIGEQPAAYLSALHRFAAHDEIDLAPPHATATEPGTIFPEDPTEVVLANLPHVTVKPASAGGWELVHPVSKPDVTIRASHIATATIQELLCGPLFAYAAGAAPGPPAGPHVESAGPTVSHVVLNQKSITFTTSRPIAKTSLSVAAFSVTDFSIAKGWSPVGVDAVEPAPAKEKEDVSSVRLDLKKKPAGDYVRLVIRGTGATPLLAADDFTPLGAPGAGADNGIDFVKMFKRS